MSTSRRPGQWSGPRWMFRQIRFRAASQEEFYHLRPTKFGGPAERCGANVVIAGVKISAVVEEPAGLFYVATACEMMEGRDAEPVGRGGVHAMLEEQFIQLARFRTHRPRGKV